MVKLAIQQAPPPMLPRMFLLTASVWGVIAGGMVMLDGELLWVSRWAAATLAWVHVLTLGVLGNAMLGSLLQFLPVAAGVAVRGGRQGAWLLYALLNLGALLLVYGFRSAEQGLLLSGSVLLLTAFVLLASLTLPGVLAAQGQRFLRLGLGSALLAGCLTALLGAILVLGLLGKIRLPVMAWTDVHAAWGLLGWVLALLAAVSRIVAPMFQGAMAASSRAQAVWQGSLYGLLLALPVLLVVGVSIDTIPALRLAAAALLGLFALAGLYLQLRSSHLRKVPLTGFWMVGLVALLLAAVLFAATPEAMQWVGVLVLQVGLPMLVMGMMLEITAFLAWIGLQRQIGRGVQVPGVQLLLPQRIKWGVWALHVVAAGLLMMGLAWRATALPLAGAAYVLAYTVSLAALCLPSWQAWRFVRGLKTRQEASDVEISNP